jgi:hypothetical protein
MKASTSRLNYFEAHVAVKILYILCHEDNIDPGHISVICWYKGQIATTRMLMSVSNNH